MSDLTARQLVLNLITGRPNKAISIANLVQAAETMGLADASVRMAATRLAQEGVLLRTGRGVYRFQSEKLRTYEHALGWRTRLDLLVPWDGSWTVVDTSGCDRSRRAGMRQQEVIISRAGFQAWRGHAYIRPNNVVDGTIRVRPQLATGAISFVVHELDDLEERRVRSLWDPNAQGELYTQLAQAITASHDDMINWEPRRSAKESMNLASTAIRSINRDPLLPDELDDKTALKSLIAVTATYQDAALITWGGLLWNEDPADTNRSVQGPLA